MAVVAQEGRRDDRAGGGRQAPAATQQSPGGGSFRGGGEMRLDPARTAPDRQQPTESSQQCGAHATAPNEEGTEAEPPDPRLRGRGNADGKRLEVATMRRANQDPRTRCGKAVEPHPADAQPEDPANGTDAEAQEPVAFGQLIDKLVDASARYLVHQLDAGVDCVQIFDSWAGTLSLHEFERWCVQPTKKLVAAVRSKKPGTKFIGFPRGAGQGIPRYVDETGVNAVSLETAIDRTFAREQIQSRVPVQGNLDPEILRTGGDALDRAVDEVMAAFAGGPFIFNLGHGITPDTPIANVERMLKRVRGI